MTATTICKVYLRRGPKKGFFYPVKRIRSGKVVAVLDSQGDWLQVSVDGRVGYLPKDSVRMEGGDDRYYELPEVLFAELSEIGKAREKGGGWDEVPPTGNDKDGRFSDIAAKLHSAELVALCLSGGGIRSATFNLGVLQGLAKIGALREIDYLSTVSGGGYIGSWLSSWISREKGSPSVKLDSVIGVLAQESEDTRGKEPYHVRFLRDYSNYLTPRVGILSVDTWTIIGTYLRNLVLNWLVLLPLLFAVLLLPRLLVHLVSGAVIEDFAPDEMLAARLFLIAGAVHAVFSIAYTVNNLPGIGDLRQSKRSFLFRFLAPLLLMACFLSAYWGYIYRPGCPVPGIGSFVGFGTAVHLVGWVVGILCLRQKPATWLTSGLACTALTGALAGFFGWGAATRLVPALLERVRYPKLLFATLSVPVILTVYLLTMALVVAFLSRRTGEQDREWWGRAAGMVILAGLVWCAGMAAVIYGPWFILSDARYFWKEIYTALGAGSGIAAAILGRGSSTPALRPGANMSKYRTTLLSFAAALFLLFLTQTLSLAATSVFWAAGYVSELSRGCIPASPLAYTTFPGLTSAAMPLNFLTHLHIVGSTRLDPALWIIAGGAMLLSFCMAWAVDINKFSMHAMYRNRLTRCYLGASRKREEREYQPFTGFDKGDDRLMTELPSRPFHVVNMAWNMVKGNRLAWQQRKAASFVMSPLFAGSDIEPDPTCKDVLPGGYRSIAEYAAGKNKSEPMTIGTAMAISGAAASPNMGYHSSPLVTFVMAFFNVRLGWWLGNTGTGMGEVWRRKSHRFSVVPLLKETFGFTREDGKDIYLSDGGHFENLGLYEMVRRRCRYIIVCDAGCDCDSTFDDLGNAVRKVRADFRVEVDLDFAAIKAKKSHFAVGTIGYACCDNGGAQNGLLLYIKPVLTGDEPADLFNYSRMHDEFPHEPTSDQWFDEAQFESYRKLGLHSLAQLAGEQKLNITQLFEKAYELHKDQVKKLPE